MFNSEEKDVTLRLKDGQEGAHKIVLCAASDVFERMLTQRMREQATGVIELPDVSKAGARALLRLIYTGHVDPADWQTERSCSRTMPVDVLLEVAMLAKRYMVKGVLSMVVHTLKVRLLAAQQQNMEAFESIYAGAIKLDIGAIRIAAVDAAKHSQAIRDRFVARQFSPEVLHELEAIWPPEDMPIKRAKLV